MPSSWRHIYAILWFNEVLRVREFCIGATSAYSMHGMHPGPIGTTLAETEVMVDGMATGGTANRWSKQFSNHRKSLTTGRKR